jgi:hypothetical protein
MLSILALILACLQMVFGLQYKIGVEYSGSGMFASYGLTVPVLADMVRIKFNSHSAVHGVEMEMVYCDVASNNSLPLVFI